MIKPLLNYLWLFLITIVLSIDVKAQGPVLKIDINHSGGRNDQSTEDGYTPWQMGVVSNLNTESLTLGGVTISISRIGAIGTGLKTNWYKLWSQDPANTYKSRLVADGVTVADGDNGAKMEVRLKGLPAGAHNLSVYLNYVDGYQASEVAPVDVYLNDILYLDNVQPKVRAKTSEASYAYLTFEAEEGRDVVIRLEAELSSPATYKNVFINGIELNAGDFGTQSHSPVPANADEHVEQINGLVQLSWTAAAGALSHDVYFGTDEQSVSLADRSSSLFKGNVFNSSFSVSQLYSMNSYYWRVDEVFADKTVKGRVWYFRPGQLAFPGAEGFGRYARGGRGGKVVYVTNLNDSGPGSLREAVTNNIGPRTIVFKVGGVIALESRLTLSDPYVTIAGQTAPGKGICIRKNPFGFSGNDVVVQNMRLRLGSGPTADGMGLTGNYSIMDHCSISWTIDEAFSSRNAKNITLQNTLISEALNIAGHQNYPAGTAHGYAATISGNTGSFHHNLLAHCYGRNWSLGGGLDANGYFASKLDIRNNVVYNWGTRATDGGAHEVNFVNNYYKPGPGTTYFYALNAQYENVGLGTQRYYFAGNVMPGRFDESNQDAGKRISLSNGQPALTYDPWVNVPFFDAPVTTQSAHHAYKIVLSNVGANQPFFDLHDTRMINETLSGTYSVTGSVSGKKGFPDSEVDAGGYEGYPSVSLSDDWDSDMDGLPDWWEKIRGTNPNSAHGDFSDANEDDDKDGFTNLDYYLQFMAEPHYFPLAGQSASINLRELAMGFSNSPSFAIKSVINGTTGTLSNGVLEFTPTPNALASFEFTVTDGEGHEMTRKVNVVGGVEVTLPVTMTEFEAERNDERVVNLRWKTVQEINNSHFEILRSDDGVKFRNIGGKINSKAVNGKSEGPLSYEFADINDNTTDTYYQLVQKDKDGRESYSTVKIVKGIPTQVNVWPIPSDREVFVSIGYIKQSAEVLLFDLQGNRILKRGLSSGQTEKLIIDTKGVYILNVRSVSDSKDLLVKKIVIR